ncbi:unnamed protein product [Linum trigynum]|uniref:Uncharacterized protein n=1 Tax=Linum trigynum TaxID=586398 RepID=A0AAV2CT30_9ROSI
MNTVCLTIGVRRDPNARSLYVINDYADMSKNPLIPTTQVLGIECFFDMVSEPSVIESSSIARITETPFVKHMIFPTCANFEAICVTFV